MKITILAGALAFFATLAACGQRADPVPSAPAASSVPVAASAKAERNLLTAKENVRDDLAEAMKTAAENQRAAEQAAGLEPAPVKK